jgi:hypothetical protein
LRSDDHLLIRIVDVDPTCLLGDSPAGGQPLPNIAAPENPPGPWLIPSAAESAADMDRLLSK